MEKCVEVPQNKNPKNSWAQVTHICNPSLSGGRDQED
jgi:hypothetical protein